ncbi:MAG: DegT/DnrJ/EryC1/StrS family aminotransferase [Planctomycetaceae bacterium]
MQVPFLDIKAQNASIWDEIEERVAPVLSEAQFILGPAVSVFETAFAKYIGTDHCIGLNNGTSALHMALIACGIGPGDEVITTPHTWISTSWAISYVGATPVFVDIDPVTYTIDVDLAEQAITSRTRAIIPVHLYGQAADIIHLRRLADDRGLALIEDVAQAHGAKMASQRLGSVGTAGCFSFYPGKNLGAFGEGGAVVTNDSQMAHRIRCLRDHAQDGRHNHAELGFNTRMEGIQGAVLSAKLPHLDSWNEQRRQKAELYRDLLDEIDGIDLPASPISEAHVWHLFVVLARSIHRDSLRQALAERGIQTGIHYPTLVPFQPAYSHLGYRRGDFPVAEDVTQNCLSLPMFPEMTEAQVEYTARMLRTILQVSTTNSPS